jgi:L-arabinose isomerase
MVLGRGQQSVASSRYAGLSKAVTQAAGNITHKLGETMDVTASEICLTRDDAIRASTKMRYPRVDLLIVCSVVWTEDEPVLTILQELPDIPVVLWCYQTKQTLPSDMSMLDVFLLSGPVGSLQLSGAIKKMGRRYGVVFGHQDDHLCVKDLNDYAEAARVATDLRKAIIGFLPHRCPQMTGTYTDEFRLRSELGPILVPVSVMEMKSVVESVSDSDVDHFVTDIRKRFKVLPEVDEDNLRHSSKVSLGLARLILKNGFDWKI